jgi:uncharacterized membrane protein HdeD (DUF308 family)
MADFFQHASDRTTFGLVRLDSVREHRGWFLGLGAAFMALGALAIFTPFIASIATALFVGWLLMIGGVAQGIHAFQNRRWGGAGWALLSAAIHVIAGLLVVIFPLTGTLTLTMVLSAFFVASGILKIIRALQHHAIPTWGWLLFDGILSLVLGGMILIGFPSTAAWALGLLVGVDLLINGSSLLLIGLSVPAPVRSRA